MKNKYLIFFLTLTFFSCKSEKEKNTIAKDDKKENVVKNQDLKKIAIEAQDALFTDYSVEGVKKYFKQNYIQHNPNVPTGIEPIIGFLPVLKEKQTNYTNHRLLRDGDYIVLHNSYHNAEPFGGNELVAFDVWRMQDGMVAEHWDNLIPKVDKTASGRSQVDGPTTITDIDKTVSNKKIVENFVNDVLFGKAPEKITDYVSATEYYQHNPAVKDGLEGLNEAIKYLTSQNNMFIYKKTHKILGEGNFVIAMSEGEWNGKPQAFYDLFRLKDDKIVEHWDVIQEIPATMANDNGKF